MSPRRSPVRPLARWIVLPAALVLLGSCGPPPEAAQDSDDADETARLIRTLEAGEPLERQAAAQALGREAEDTTRAARALVAALADPDPTVVAELQRALVRIGPRAVPALIEGLRIADARVQTGSLMIFTRFGAAPPEAVSVVDSLLREHPRWEVRFRSAEALGALGPAATPAVETLREAAAEDEDANVRRESERALERIARGEAPT